MWSHLNAVPERFGPVATQLRQPVLDTRVTQERATVQLGKNADTATTASLIMEHGFWVVDEIRVASRSGELVGIRENLRGEIATRLLSGSYSTLHSSDGHDVIVPIASGTAGNAGPTGIQQASAEMSFGENKSQVRHAVYTREENMDGTMPSGTLVKPAVKTRNFGENDMPAATASSAGAIQTAGFERPLQRQ